jgi:hypothetical protein
MVATSTAGQNNSGWACTKANTAGSEPMGSKVADSVATRNTAGKPTDGSANQARVLAMKEGIQLSMAVIVARE